MAPTQRREEEERCEQARIQRLKNLSEEELVQAGRHEFDVPRLQELNREYDRQRKYEREVIARGNKEEIRDLAMARVGN